MIKKKKFEYSPVELFLSTIDKNTEKKEFILELESQFDDFFGNKNGKVLLYTSSERNKSETESLHHTSIQDIKKYYLEDVSILYDKIDFSRVDVEHRSSSELNITFWRSFSWGGTGYSVYIRIITDDEYNKILSEIENLAITKVDENIKNYYYKLLQESCCIQSIENLQKKVLNKLNNIFVDVLSNLEDDLNEYISLKDNDILNLIFEKLNEDNDETYLIFKDLIKGEYVNIDCIKFSLNGKIFLTFKRTTKIKYNFEYE